MEGGPPLLHCLSSQPNVFLRTLQRYWKVCQGPQYKMGLLCTSQEGMDWYFSTRWVSLDCVFALWLVVCWFRLHPHPPEKSLTSEKLNRCYLRSMLVFPNHILLAFFIQLSFWKISNLYKYGNDRINTHITHPLDSPIINILPVLFLALILKTALLHLTYSLPIKIYSSVVFRIFMELYSYHHCLMFSLTIKFSVRHTA